MMFFASLGQYLLEVFPNPVPSYMVWPLFSIVAGALTFIRGRKEEKERVVKSHLNDAVGAIWQAFGFSMFVALFITNARSPHALFPFCLILMALGTYTTGKIVRFKPLVYGAYVSWGLALLSFNFSFNEQILAYAFGLLCSYIVPGYILKSRATRHVQGA
jgi:hypothetical protein